MKLGKKPLYEPRGGALELFTAQDAEVLLEGPAGTGKSRAWLEKLHLLAQKYAGSRLLLCRKTRKSLTESALVTFERAVLPVAHPAREGPRRGNRSTYRYPNGSEILVGGMDRPSKILSTEFDVVFVQEATELTEEDWETLLTRLRSGAIPYQQVGGDCNPDRPGHWLNVRCHSGKTRRILSRHEDNPLFWDGDVSDWTESGRKYLQKLDGLSGARRARFRDGIWAISEGVIFEGFNRSVHVIQRFVVPEDWRIVWVVDFGFTHPFVWEEWAIDPDGRAFLIREIYRTQRLVEDHVGHMLRLSAVGKALHRVEALVCDHDAEGRATLSRNLSLPTRAAIKSVSDGLQAVQSRLRIAGDGKPRLFIFSDALAERDESLSEARRPTWSLEEVETYVWAAGREMPVKVDDHGMDCWRYLCMYLDSHRKRRRAQSFSGD